VGLSPRIRSAAPDRQGRAVRCPGIPSAGICRCPACSVRCARASISDTGGTERRTRSCSRHPGRLAPCEGHRPENPTGDFAQVLKDLTDRHVPDRTIVLLLDSPDIHKLSTLHEAFPPAGARRLVERFEVHHTPKHGFWPTWRRPGSMSSPGNACPVAFPIATVNVRNLDDDVVDCLKWCASSNESSRKGEVRHMLEAPPTPGPRRLWTGSVRKLGLGSHPQRQRRSPWAAPVSMETTSDTPHLGCACGRDHFGRLRQASAKRDPTRSPEISHGRRDSPVVVSPCALPDPRMPASSSQVRRGPYRPGQNARKR